MKKLSLAFVSVVSMLAVGACKKGAENATAGSGSAAGSATTTGSATTGSPAAATSSFDPKAIVAKVATFKDQMCACKDKGCAEKVNADYSAWGKEMTRKMLADGNPPKPDDATVKQVTDIAKDYAACMTTATGAAGAEIGSGSAAAPVEAAGPGGDPVVKEGLAKMSEYADKMCACTDKACTDKVGAELVAWGKEMESKHPATPKPSADEQKKMQDFAMKYGNCMMKITK
ncbi:MAG TPA: hypothetical protein VGM90_22250 [Kofleriaceae bacterium]|jgi:hypothetical protein